MYVIMDIEWIENHQKRICPTQIAALRVDHRWNRMEMYSSLIKPFDDSCHDWNHVSYNGYGKQDFLSAPTAPQVLYTLFRWLRNDDILLWWKKEPGDVFESLAKRIMNYEVRQPVRMVYPTASSLCKAKGSACKMAQSRGLQVPNLQHVSINDVETIRTLMASILFSPAGIAPRQYHKETPAKAIKYYFEPGRDLLHIAGSDCLKDAKNLQGFETLKTCIQKKLRPCPLCCAQEYRKESAKITADVIARTDYNFVYQSKSEVFHTSKCVHARRIPYWAVKGSVYIDTCRNLGKRPCGLCMPTANYIKHAAETTVAKQLHPSAEKNIKGMSRKLSVIEERALKRHIQAIQEREALVSESNNQDFKTLTSSSYVFWSGRGYSTFHLRDCPKLAGLSELRGYARYDHAVSKGLSPCKHCKPSRKHDLVITIPGGSEIREGESVSILDDLCKRFGYTYKQCDYLYYISTPVGKWRLHIQKRPVELWHINLVNCRGSMNEYHKQPRMLLSLTDTFHYIHGHDKALMKQLRFSANGCASEE